jgi:peptidoglycan/LPS O-acetylase OafA/YrhL
MVPAWQGYNRTYPPVVNRVVIWRAMPNKSVTFTMPTVASRFDERDNAITPLRLILAITVIAFHAWPIGGFGRDPAQVLSGDQAAGGGTLAVLAFFALSGFLLGGSRLRLDPIAFVWRRALRIVPGYWVCIAATSLAVGAQYFGATWLIATDVGNVTSPLLTTAPYGPQVNAPIWTLWPEVVCYLILAATPSRYAVIAAPTLAAFWLAAYTILPLPDFLLAMTFFIGVAMRLLGRFVPLHGALAAGLLGVFAGASVLGFYNLAAPLAMSYLAIWAGVRMPLRWTHDLSYGTYIYAFPIAQVLALIGVQRLGLLPFGIACVAATLPVAAVSWFLIERPALSLKELRPGTIRARRLFARPSPTPSAD